MPDIPTPRQVALWTALDAVHAEEAPGWAAHWLAAGEDGDDLRTLAGLGGRDTGEVRDVLEGALADCGASIPAADVAAAAQSFNHLARMFADGRAGAEWVVQKVSEIVDDHRVNVDVQPLGRLAGKAGEAGEEEVARACGEQLTAWA
ncbi:hypothetical protein [Saccharothrix sp. NRRL B-16314]|uniref:hypothetical protein n=1 Tax=Saccharothrix sp. NRRL B-16314 TaxID=1463825 RepID=UPI0012DE5C83|nr:hypothetical protein [Saccharothrix sp. NRRL B-16314]